MFDRDRERLSWNVKIMLRLAFLGIVSRRRLLLVSSALTLLIVGAPDTSLHTAYAAPHKSAVPAPVAKPPKPALTIQKDIIFIAVPAPVAKPPKPTLTMERDIIYVVGPGLDKSPGFAIGVASELNKFTRNAWVIPDPSIDTAGFAARCVSESDKGPRVLGFIVVAFSLQETDRFYVVIGRQATHLYPFVQIIACPSASKKSRPAPTIIGIISQLHAANFTPWVIRQIEISVPLVSYAGVVGAFKAKSDNAKNTTTDLLVAAGALSNAGSFTIPGYNPGTRLLHATQHLADDLVRELLWICTPVKAPDAGAALCSEFSVTPKGQK